MDPLTHGLVGATCAQCLSDKESFRTASVVGFLAALAPDLDVFLGSSSDPLLTLELHRHFTHSLLFAPFGSLIVAGILWWLVRKKLTFKSTYLFSLMGYTTAGVMDYITSYGVYLFWPLIDERFSLNIISVFDPVFTSVILGISVAAFIKQKKTLSIAVLCWLLLYLSFGFFQKSRVTETAFSHIQKSSELVAKPTIGNQVLWSVRYKDMDQICGFGVKAGLFSPTAIIEGNCVPMVDWEREFNSSNHTVLYNDIRRFSDLSDGFLVRHPDYPNVLGDGRYSMLPTTLSPLWGITVDSTQTEQHVTFDTYRDASEEVREAFLQMVLQ